MKRLFFKETAVGDVSTVMHDQPFDGNRIWITVEIGGSFYADEVEMFIAALQEAVKVAKDA